MSPDLIPLTVDNIIPTLSLKFNEHTAKYSSPPTRLTISWHAWKLLSFNTSMLGSHGLLSYDNKTPTFNGALISIDCDILDDLLYFTEGRE